MIIDSEFWINSRDIIFSIVFGSFGLTFLALFNLLLASKKQLLRGYKLFQQDKAITKKDMSHFSMSLFDLFYMLEPIPLKKSAITFYELPLIKKKRDEYITLRKWFLIFLAIYGILIFMIIRIDIYYDNLF